MRRKEKIKAILNERKKQTKIKLRLITTGEIFSIEEVQQRESQPGEFIRFIYGGGYELVTTD